MRVGVLFVKVQLKVSLCWSDSEFRDSQKDTEQTCPVNTIIMTLIKVEENRTRSSPTFSCIAL